MEAIHVAYLAIGGGVIRIHHVHVYIMYTFCIYLYILYILYIFIFFNNKYQIVVGTPGWACGGPRVHPDHLVVEDRAPSHLRFVFPSLHWNNWLCVFYLVILMVGSARSMILRLQWIKDSSCQPAQQPKPLLTACGIPRSRWRQLLHSSAPIVLPYPSHLGTFSQIHSMELFQTTTNAYI